MTKRLVRKYESALVDIIEGVRTDIHFVLESTKAMQAAPANIDVGEAMAKIRVILNEMLLGRSQALVRQQMISIQLSANIRADQLLAALGIKPTQGFTPADRGILDILMERNIGSLKGLTDDIGKDITREITDGMANGESMRDLAKRIDAVTDAGIERSRVIARTETLYAYNTVAKDRYKRNGIEEMEWLAATDERVCDICGPLDGQRFKLGDEPDCPIHPQCLLPGTMLEAPGGAVAGLRARYDGPTVELVLAGGGRLTVTENHLVLTPHGFAAANLLRKGDDIVYCPTFKGCGPGNPYDDREPSLVEDVFDALKIAGGMTTRRVPIAAEDVHGDARSLDGYVDVVAPDGLLRCASESAGGEHFEAYDLGPAPGLAGFVGPGPHDHLFLAAARAADGGVSGARQSSPFFMARLGHAKEHGLAPVSLDDARLLKAQDNSGACDIEVLGQLLDGVASPIKAQKIVDVNVHPYHGWVYDIQTVSTLCICNGIVTSNCRCTLIPVVEGF